jgi:hypothetical protein
MICISSNRKSLDRGKGLVKVCAVPLVEDLFVEAASEFNVLFARRHLADPFIPVGRGARSSSSMLTEVNPHYVIARHRSWRGRQKRGVGDDILSGSDRAMSIVETPSFGHLDSASSWCLLRAATCKDHQKG